MGNSRLQKSSKNIKYTLVAQIITYIFTFIDRTVFIKILSAEYLGINGLFGNILSVLALAELGIGVAINYFLYKPLAIQDKEKICAYMNFYSFAYRLIGGIVIALGLLMLPFLNSIIKENISIPNLKLIYTLYVFNSGATYFFSYKRSLFIADQKGYIDTANLLLSTFTKTILQIIVLIITKNFIFYLITQIGVIITFNILISHKVDKHYPYLKEYKKVKLQVKERKELFKYIGAMMSHKVGAVVVNGTDNIIISTFVSIVSVGLYSNYLLIVSSISKIISQIYASLTASVGNLSTSSNNERQYLVFNRIFFINMWISCFCTVSLWTMLQPFITFWVGKQYLLDKSTVAIIVINFYILIMRKPVQTFKIAGGYFWNDRYRPIAEALINLIASILLVRVYGIMGVFLGTMISSILTNFWIEPYVVYKYGFKKDVLLYFYKYMQATLLTVILSFLTDKISNVVLSVNFIGILLKVSIVAIFPNLIMLLLFYRTEEFKYLISVFKVSILKHSSS